MIPFCLFSVICITKTIGFFLFIFPKSVNRNMMLNMSFPNNTSSAILIYICPQIPTFHPHFGNFFFILILFPPFSSFFFFIFYPLLLEKCHTHAHTHITNTLILKSWFYPILLPFHFPNSVIYSIVQAQSLRILLNTLFSLTLIGLQILLIPPPKCASNLFILLYFFFSLPL